MNDSTRTSGASALARPVARRRRRSRKRYRVTSAAPDRSSARFFFSSLSPRPEHGASVASASGHPHCRPERQKPRNSCPPCFLSCPVSSTFAHCLRFRHRCVVPTFRLLRRSSWRRANLSASLDCRSTEDRSSHLRPVIRPVFCLN